MKRRILGLMVAVLALAGASPLEASQASDKREEVFQAAVAQYEAGHYSEAAVGLERLVREMPNSFDVHELLGLVDAAQSEDVKANDDLAKAVQLKPESAAGRSDQAGSYAKLGQFESAPQHLH